MVVRPLHQEVGGGLPGSGQFGSDAREIRLQGVVGQSGPVAPDGCIEGVGPGRINAVVGPIDPHDVGTETGGAGEVDGEMDPEATVDRHRIDQPFEGRPPGPQPELVALGEVAPRHVSGGKPDE